MLTDNSMQENGSRDATGNQPTRNGSGLSAPTISLPKGGGAVRGMGEKFAANPVTGTGSMSVPSATSPGRSGFGPELSLSSDSGAGNHIYRDFLPFQYFKNADVSQPPGRPAAQRQPDPSFFHL